MKENKSIKKLNLCYNSLGEEEIKELSMALENHPKIEKLYLDGNNFGENGLKIFSQVIKKNKTLKLLSISKIKTEGGMKEFCESLIENNTLNSIDYSINDISYEEMEYLTSSVSKNTKIEKLDLSYNGISNFQIGLLSSMLKTSQSLTKLILKGNKLGDCFVALLDSLKTGENIKLIDLSFTGLYYNEINDFSDFIATNKSLKKLYLCGNDLSSCSDSFSKAISSNFSITKLYITKCGDINPILNSFIVNQKITELHLSKNMLDLNYVNKIIQKNSTLKKLFLDRTFSTQQIVYHFEDICDSLASNQSIKLLDLTGNNLKNENILSLSESLSQNNSIKYLYLSLNSFNEIGVDHLHNALKVNHSLSKIELDNLTNYVNKSSMDMVLWFNSKWSVGTHTTSPYPFRFAVSSFLFCLKRIQSETKLKIPKFVVFEIIKRIDKKSFHNFIKTNEESPKKKEHHKREKKKKNKKNFFNFN